MPQAPTANMLLVLPTDKGDTNLWDSILDTAVGLIDAHDHTAGKGVKVPMAGVKVDADKSWSDAGTYRAIKDLLAIDFQPSAAASMAGYAGALFCNSADNELYWRTTGGANVKLTAGASINASLIGGIGGDYAAIGALVSFVDANDNYLFQQQVGAAVRQYARMACADVDLFEYKAQPAAGVPANRVRLASPAALAGSYTVTWLAALPAASRIIAIDNTGLMTAGVSTAMNVDANITLSGLGTYKHGTKTIARSLINTLFNVSAGTVNATGGQAGVSLANNTIAYHPLPELPTHAQIQNVTVWFNSAADRNACTCKLFVTSSADPALTAFTDTGIAFPNAGTAQSKATAVNQTPAGSQTYWVQISNSATTPKVQAVTVDFNVP